MQAPPAALLEKDQAGRAAEKKAAAPAREAQDRQQSRAAKKTQEQATPRRPDVVLDLNPGGLGGLTTKNIKALDAGQAHGRRGHEGRLGRAQHLSAWSRPLMMTMMTMMTTMTKTAARRPCAASEERQAEIAALVTQLWVTIRKGKKALEGKLEEGASKSGADAQLGVDPGALAAPTRRRRGTG